MKKTIFYEDVDLVQKMKESVPVEGLNILHTFRVRGDRLKLGAIVKGQQIRQWVAIGPDGKQVAAETFTVVNKKKGGTKKPPTCWSCSYDGAGDLHCFVIPCPKGPWTTWPKKLGL